MTDKALFKPELDPERYKQEKNGAIRDKRTGKIVAMNPDKNPARFTPENARAMQKRGRQIALLKHLRGIASAVSDLPQEASWEEITAGAGDAIEALARHYTQTFLQSKNLRGMAESYGKLTAPLLSDNEPSTDDEMEKIPPFVILLIAELARRKERGEIIDANPRE